MGRPVRRAKCAQPGHMYTCPTQYAYHKGWMLSKAQWVKLSTPQYTVVGVGAKPAVGQRCETCF